MGSPWVGLKNFRTFFDSYLFGGLVANTLLLSLYSLIASFPIPIIFAVFLNNISNKFISKAFQLVLYAPYFISVVVLVSIIIQLLSPTIGVVSRVLTAFGFDAGNLMGDPRYFRHIYVWSGVWQNSGFGTVIFLAALSSVDPNLHEAAIMDGATLLQRNWHIDIPSIASIIVIVFILSTGQIMDVGFEKVYLMQNPLNLSVSEVIQTYVYKVGFGVGRSNSVPNYSFSAAVGLFNSFVSFVLIVFVNFVARRVGETSLW